MMHQSHIIRKTYMIGVHECLRCSACTCHCSDDLEVPCKGIYRTTKKEVVVRRKYLRLLKKSQSPKEA